MSPKGGGSPNGISWIPSILLRLFDEFKNQFSAAGTTRFGSGWAWLIVKDEKLIISSTPNQDNPLMDVAESEVFQSWVWMFGNMLII